MTAVQTVFSEKFATNPESPIHHAQQLTKAAIAELAGRIAAGFVSSANCPADVEKRSIIMATNILSLVDKSLPRG